MHKYIFSTVNLFLKLKKSISEDKRVRTTPRCCLISSVCDSRCLEEVHPPVSGAQVEDVGSLAVVRSLHGQRVMDGNGVLQVFVWELLIGPVLPLRQRSKRETLTCVVQQTGAETERKLEKYTQTTSSSGFILMCRGTVCLVRGRTFNHCCS